MKFNFAIPMLALVLAASAHAQKDKWAVVVNCTNEDNDIVGMRLCTAVRDEIARSPRYYEASSESYALTLHIVTASYDDEFRTTSVQAVAITMDGPKGEYYLTNSVLITGANRVKFSAQEIVASLDHQAEIIREAARARKP